MKNILGFKHKLSYYLSLIDSREQAGDLWGVLDACRNAKRLANCKVKKQSFDVLIANTYFKMEQYPLACESFFKAISVPELRAACFFGVGKSLTCLNNFNLALDYFETALKWDNENKFSEEILWWTDYILSKINSPQIANLRVLEYGKKLLKNKQYIEAEKVLKTIAQKNDKAGNFYALSLFLNDKTEFANSVNQQNLTQKNNIFALCLQYEINKKMHSEKLNNEVLKQIVTKKSQNPDYMLNKALFLFKNQMYAPCLQALKECLDLNEYNPKVLLFCAEASYNVGNIEDALYYTSRARWIDFDNPVYLFYFDLFKKEKLKKPVKLSQKLDSQISQQKISELKQNLQSHQFVSMLFKNHFLLEDFSYGFLADNDICNRASCILVESKKQEPKQFFNDMLVSIKPTFYQKFLMVRQSFYSEKFNKIRFVSGFKFLEIKTNKADFKHLNAQIKAGVCNAFSYAFCFGLGQNEINNILKTAKKIQNKNIFLMLNENELSCLLFCKNQFIFKNACLFFGVQESRVVQFTSLIDFSNMESYENGKI